MQSDATFSNLFTRNIDNKINYAKELEYETLSKRMMTIWTNFAKTGYVQTKLIASPAAYWIILWIPDLDYKKSQNGNI